MLRAAVDKGRGDAQVDVFGLQVEQGHGRTQQLTANRLAVGGRRLQRGGGQRALLVAFDTDSRLVQLQLVQSFAIAPGQCRTQRNGRVAAERHLGFGGEIAHAPDIALGHRERGFRIANLGGDRLHRGVIGEDFANPHAGRVAALIGVGKRRESEDVQCHVRRILAPWGSCASLVQSGHRTPTKSAYAWDSPG
jgi:hypothetical protein